MSQLTTAVEAFGKLEPKPASTASLTKTLVEALGDGRNAAEPLLRQMLSLQGLAVELNLSGAQLFEGLTSGLQTPQAGWTKEDFDAWLRLSELLRRLFDQEVLRLSAKAVDLSYEHSELLRNARIVTDIRPVFNSDASEIKGTVISHSLLLRYDDVEGDHVLTLAIDEDDILSLVKQCERALKKSKTAEAFLETKAQIRPIVPGRDRNERT